MFLDIILFVIGFYILIKGANFLVDGSSSLARNLGMSSFLIGLVIVGLGTSIPEFAITFISNFTTDIDMGVGTLVGSSTFNILFILGISSFFLPIAFKSEWIEDVLWNIWVVALVVIFAILPDSWTIGRIEGFLLLAIFCYWLYDNIKRPSAAEDEGPLKIFAYPIAVMMIIFGFVGVILGGKWVVSGAELLARELGLGEGIIGLTILSIGTSLPELVVTFTAALKRQAGIAIGNIVGSNVVNFLLIFGAAAAAKPILFSKDLINDSVIAIFSAGILYMFMFLGEKKVLERWQGAIMVILYFAYLIFIGSRVLAS